MSKPNSCKRGKGYYIGYGYSSTELDAVKGIFNYHRYIHEEITNLEKIGNSRILKKLRKYRQRAM